ncbi:MAG: NAD-dependent epimerase/dehydratase family protein [Gemmataceae bacterium]|nr:NAD-dependent epimerase/dehydratase family protein [Gemmataceae bacterium]
MKALVTGGGGFLGGAVVRMLLDRGATVRSFSRGSYPVLDRWGVEQFHGDLGDAAAVARAVRGCDIVYHVAAKAGSWGPYREYFRANVLGTRHVIAACRAAGVARLVFTSSPSVVHAGGDLEGVDETVPIARHFEANYPRTKAQAECEALAANGPDLSVVALRPHLVWGPGDNHLVPRLIARARAGKFRFVGDGRQRVDVTYVDNAARAHLLAGDRLAPGSPVAGRAYFISQGEPVEIKEFINRILAVAGLPPIERHISRRAAMAVASVLEWGHAVFRPDVEPRLTRFLVSQFATSHWYDVSAARRDFGYSAEVSTAEGLVRLGKWLKDSPPPA